MDKRHFPCDFSSLGRLNWDSLHAVLWVVFQWRESRSTDFEDLASEVIQCNFCHILLVKASHKTSLYSSGRELHFTSSRNKLQDPINTGQTQGTWFTEDHYFNNLPHKLRASLIHCLLKGRVCNLLTSCWDVKYIGLRVSYITPNCFMTF